MQSDEEDYAPLTIPLTVLPHPNAFDLYVQAGNALVQRSEIVHALNGRLVQPEASPAVRGTALTRSYSAPEPSRRPYELGERRELLHKNAKALQILRNGFNLKYRHPPTRSTAVAFPHFERFRQLASLLRLEGIVHAEEGDLDAALHSWLDAVRFGCDIPHGAGGIGAIVGAACQSIGRKEFWNVLPSLSSRQACRAMKRLSEIMPHQVLLQDVWQEERWALLASRKEMMTPGWRSGWEGQISRELQPIDPEQIEQGVIFWHNEGWAFIPGFPKPTRDLTHDEVREQVRDTIRNVEARQSRAEELAKRWDKYDKYTDADILRELSRYHDAQMQSALLPYAEQVANPPFIEPALDPANTAKPISSALDGVVKPQKISYLTNSRFRLDLANAQNALLLTSFAIQAFRVENGRYPASLQDLAPDYIEKIPVDPFAPGELLRYRSENICYVLYSVGPDGEDNDGQPAYQNDASNGAYRAVNAREVKIESRGDIVAGVNIS